MDYNFSNNPLDSLDLFTVDEKNIPDIISFVEASMGDQVNATEATDILFKLLNRSVEKNSRYITWMLGMLFAFGFVFLILITLYVEHHDLYEMSIMTCIGKSKKDILLWRLEQTIIQVALGVGSVIMVFIIFSKYIVSYWIYIFTQIYQEGSINYQFTYEYNAIYSQINIGVINYHILLVSILIVILSLLVVCTCNLYYLCQKTKNIIDKAI